MAERVTPLELPPDEFRRLGHDLVDRIADFLGSLRDRPLTSGETPAEIRALLGRAPLPRAGTAAAALLPDTARLLFDHSLFNGHPRFMGYITSSAAPLGALADLLAATVNPNVGGWELSPVASEIEAQTVRWVAELVGYPVDCGGLLVSGGNMANFVCFLAGRRAMLGEPARAAGLAAEGAPLRVYASAGTHTWIQKAADLFGFGTDAVRWIPTDGAQRMRTDALRERIREDLARGDRPIMVVGSRGFRALKVWLGLRQAGRDGYVRMIGDDCRLAEALHRNVAAHPELEAATLGLSIATFRYVPRGLRDARAAAADYLNTLNETLLARLKTGGELFVTNAVLDGRFLLRACIVNFRTTEADVAAIPAIVARTGRAVDAELRPGRNDEDRHRLSGGAPVTP